MVSGMTQHIGIIAVTAEGAALCYRTLCLEGAELFGRYAHPEITIHTFPLADYMRHVEAEQWQEVGAMLLASAGKLRAAGAELLICPVNTVHQAVDLVRERLPLPCLHIAEEVARVAAERQRRRVLVLGTRYLMESPVYPSKLASWNIAHEVPDAETRERINALIFDELVYGRFENPARAYFREVIGAAQRRGCDAVILGCTEIPLLLNEADSPLPMLDSTRILARAALHAAARADMSTARRARPRR
jgi:aspartate racemase